MQSIIFIQSEPHINSTGTPLKTYGLESLVQLNSPFSVGELLLMPGEDQQMKAADIITLAKLQPMD